jgi:quercetin dioxygenase-like cupin family protein
LSPTVALSGPGWHNRLHPEGIASMLRSLTGLALALSVAGLAPRHDDGEIVKPVASRDIAEKLDGQDTKATVVEVSLDPGRSGSPHRHPGPAFGYVLEGEYEWAIDDQPACVLKAGETFYEPSGCFHRVSRNPSADRKARFVAVVLHPSDAQDLVIPEAPH